MMTMPAPYRPVTLGPVKTTVTSRADGTTLVQQATTLNAYPTRLTEKLLYWATHTPDAIFMARRDANGVWQPITYAQTLAKVCSIAQAMLDRGLSRDRTLVILSENSIEHALMALAALHIGVPYAPISTAYSLIATDFGKLRHCVELMTPGVVFVSDGAKYARALEAVVPAEVEVVVTHNAPANRAVTLFEQLIHTPATDAVDAAFARVTPDTAAKVLFTSGSTALPKGVINTHRMMCANLQQIMQTYPFIGDEPPVFVDWLPWNHTFGGNHNVGLTLYNGGTLYIDDGRPTPSGIEQTIANLREIAPTVYFNVPKGFEELLPRFRHEPELCQHFFSRVKMLFYAGAGLPQHVWDGFEQLSADTCGERVLISSGLGMTESGPSAMFINWFGGKSGLLGVPVAGMTLKLVPNGDKTEVRYRGPNLTPGYWRQPELTASYFDDEGFYRTGDAVKWVDAAQPDLGFVFDGRIAEDFKLTTGTWVSVGVLRAKLVAAGAPLIQDAVITGIDRDEVGAIIFPNMAACRKLIDAPTTMRDDAVVAHDTIREAIQHTLQRLAQASTGSSTLIQRAVITAVPPSIDVGEITDKGSLNQRAVLRHRAEVVAGLYVGGENVIEVLK